MKTTTKLSQNVESKLEKYIVNYLKNYSKDNEEIESHILDVLNYGCQSGAVGSLVYYSDTLKFYKKYQNEINELIKESQENFGYSISDLLRDFDHDDMLCLEIHNQNLLAWFAFEETLRNLCLKSEVLENEI